MANSWRKGTEEPESDFRELGNQRFKAGDHKEAIKLYTKGLNADPTPSDAQAAVLYQNRAAAFEKMGKTDLVVKDCTRALAKNPKYAKAYWRRGCANSKLGDDQNALFDFTAATILDKSKDDWEKCKAESLQELVEKKIQETMAEWMSGSKQVPISTTYVDWSLSSFCEDPTLLGRIKPPTGNRKRQQEPADPNDTALAEVHSLLKSQRYGEVIAACEPVVKGGGESEAEARLIRLSFAFFCCNFALFFKDLKALFPLLDSMQDKEKAKKMKVNAYIQRAECLLELGREAEGIKDFGKAEVVDPENADTLYHRAMILFHMKQKAKAREDMERAIKLRPDWPVPKVMACYMDYRLAEHKPNSADAQNVVLRRLVQIVHDFPNCCQGYSVLCSLYSERSNLAAAEATYDKALKLNPNNANIYAFKGMLKRGQGKMDEAVCLVKKSLEIDPYYVVAHTDLGLLEMERRNVMEALESLDRGLEVANTLQDLKTLFGLKEGLAARLKAAMDLAL